MSVLVVSFDAVGDKVFEAMAKDGAAYPNVAKFMQGSFYRGGIKTVFVSNTYPVHASVSTGSLPKDHGIISNLLPPKKNKERPWAQKAELIKTKTIWDAAKEKKLSTAAFLWPVTCGAKIDYHIPEVHPEKGQNLLFQSLLYGSVFFQLSVIIKFAKLLFKALKSISRGGAGQPELDNFTAAAAHSLLKRKKCDLVLVHLIAYDSIFHFFGSKGREIEEAKKALDSNLGMILENWGDETVIIFSDHSQLDAAENINLSEIYGDAVFEQAGGCAFFDKTFAQNLSAVKNMEKQPWFGRHLTNEELEESGYSGALGAAAKEGYVFTSGKYKYKGSHGYPADYKNYNVFYCVKGRNFPPGQNYNWLKNQITDTTAIIAKELNLDMEIR